MDINVNYLDSNSVTHNETHTMTRLAFVKHLAMAGQGFAPRTQNLIRTLGMLFHYSGYIQRTEFYNNRFSRPDDLFYDPTEINQFSNLAGKAIADFLSKRIDNSLLTINYEAAMRLCGMPISGSRPDLLAFKSNSIFAIEAKGRTNDAGDMNEHKKQSKTGDIQVNYSIASVAYNLYDEVHCNYHDPINENVPYNFELLNAASKEYYSGMLDFLNEKYFYISETTINDEKYFEIRLKANQYTKLFSTRLSRLRFYDFYEFDFPSLLLIHKAEKYAKEGLSDSIKVIVPKQKDVLDNHYLYIDNDGIGLRFR